MSSNSILKQRLVGAIVLVALGVIFIPMLLEGPGETLIPEVEELPEPQKLQPALRPPRLKPVEELPAEPDRLVITQPTQEAPTSGGATASADAAPANETGEAGTPEVPANEAGTPEAPAKPAQAAITPPPQAEAAPATRAAHKALGSWVVQVGSYSREANALAQRDKLRKADFPTQVEKARVKDKTLYRVRIGPFLERTEAEASAKRLVSEFKLKGRVMSYP